MRIFHDSDSQSLDTSDGIAFTRLGLEQKCVSHECHEDYVLHLFVQWKVNPSEIRPPEILNSLQ